MGLVAVRGHWDLVVGHVTLVGLGRGKGLVTDGALVRVIVVVVVVTIFGRCRRHREMLMVPGGGCMLMLPCRRSSVGGRVRRR